MKNLNKSVPRSGNVSVVGGSTFIRCIIPENGKRNR
nr:MAG TPA: hypothetical protein [Bacteriophage sp.]